MKEPRARLYAAFASVLLGAVVSPQPAVAQDAATATTVAERAALEPQIERRLLAIDPSRISEQDVREVLMQVPAPRIILLQGSVPIHTMAPFAEFLIAMGYPAEKLRNPGDGSLSYSSFIDSREIAGAIAWHYERDGLMPMLIGHSQGGMLAVKVLQDLAGASGAQLAVWNPVHGSAEKRHSIIDPRSGRQRPVVGLQVPYAAALATGGLMRILLGQWNMVSRLRSVPDSADEFTGFFIAWDAIAGTGPDAAHDDPYRATGQARVRNVMLPADYGHIALPVTRHLADEPATRHWISNYDPHAQPAEPPHISGVDLRNIVHAADVWFSVKANWCLEAQRTAHAARVSPPSPQS